MDVQYDLKSGASRLAWEQPVLRRLDASDAQQDSSHPAGDFHEPNNTEGKFHGNGDS